MTRPVAVMQCVSQFDFLIGDFYGFSFHEGLLINRYIGRL
uniref:Uncharacterized protein n=1 Tax=Anguilla anguilla TaxID=7936 RepID=A0A0E9T018_ANGAN